jgi:peroxiredoxin
MLKFLIITLFSVGLYAEALNIKPVNFTLPVYGSKEKIELKEIHGKKVLINFWASWCTSCIQELPELHHLKEMDKKGEYRFIAINAGDTKKKIKKFVKKYGFNYEILMDKSREVSKNWGVTNLPVTVVLDKRGKVIFKGIRPPKKLP